MDQGLTGCWLAYHGGDAEALDVIETIRAQVPRLEALGITEAHTRAWQKHAFTPDDLRPPDNEPMRALSSAGITQVSRVVEASEGLMKDHGGQVQVVRGFGVDRPADRNFPVTVIEEQLREPALHRSDINKLLEVDDATARHLWLWVEITEGLAMIRSFDVEGLPDVGIATEIDGVWLGRSPAPDVVAGYVWFRDVGWSRFESSRNEVIAS